MKNLPISAVVISYNEGHLLKPCLSSISFCKEIILVDLESTDETQKIAKAYATKVITHPKVITVEHIRYWIRSQTKYDWILFTDPDEVYSECLKHRILALWPNLDQTVGAIRLPIQYYFKNHPLRGTIWGGEKSRLALRHKRKNNFTTLVHTDIHLKPEFQEIAIEGHPKQIIHHFWATSFHQLYSKHRRYIQEEGKAMSVQGIHYQKSKQIYQSIKAFWICFKRKKGYLDGWLGFRLSLFWMWYTFCRWDALRKFEKNKKREHESPKK